MKMQLPQEDGSLLAYHVKGEPVGLAVAGRAFNREAYAAAHVVVDPIASGNSGRTPVVIDWDATLAFREYLWSHGFKVAEAMDTAQRGMGLDWPEARELIQRSVRHAKTRGGGIACGVGTDQLSAERDYTLAEIEAAYLEQLDVVEAEGGDVILMASRALARAARNADDYLTLYGRLLDRASRPVILHWLGEMFDPSLAGYWGSATLSAALDTVVTLIAAHADKVDGIKVSLLDPQWEVALRRRLPASVKMYTGDDFNYADMIAGDEHGHSHALLGIFDPIASVAAAALERLAAGDVSAFRSLLDPTVELSREIFRSPTQYYKSGVVFLAWLNGHQEHFSMVAGAQSARGVAHYAKVFQLADACGALRDPNLACERLASYLRVACGISV
ncbi:dihydrodipicolinate synthase family protein [Paraburkholderia acidisoli]|uniref:DUF993 family protein n=1 Tax=Paraburkholderia acidisoli TaxID=2571748 RepID=A0A7Z2GMF6_9BURK|nr:dihydrodipicolinate synthase family protein [Paraburkholderia acidisoli]QGZ64286.1 DUF993 family protein [Paraburkholderia acidisoli]